MSDQSDRLSLPFILPNQAQKHVTHNESLQLIDALMHLALRGFVTEPPATVADGDVYAISTSATGLFAGHDGDLALRIDGIWTFVTPKPGFLAFHAGTGKLLVYQESGGHGLWAEQSLALPETGRFSQLGINATADAGNKLSVAADTTLFTHQGTGHRLKLNKAAAAETASLLLQDNFSGRAEIGLNGSDDLSFKVSADGTTWRTALSVGSGDGIVRAPQAPRVRVTPAVATTVTLASLASYTIGFGTPGYNQGNWTLGNAVPTPGSGRYLIVPADGFYLVSFNLLVTTTTTAITANLQANGTTVFTWRQMTSVGGAFTAMVPLTAGMALSIYVWPNVGTMTLDFTLGRTELSLALL